MNKKVVALVSVVVVVALAIGGFFFFNRNNDPVSSSAEVSEIKKLKDNGAKVLVVYYSAQSHTEKISKTIADQTGADLVKLEAAEEYTSDDLNYGNSSSRVSREHDDESLRNAVKLKTNKIDNFDDYDIVLIGYPIWWGEAAWPINDFVRNNDFGNKTVIPFCSAYSSGIGQSGKLLEEMATGGNWQTGKRFAQDESDDVVKQWVKEMNLSK